MLTFENTKIKCTISSGIASFADGFESKDNIEELIYRRADSALYYSKEHGRDRVSLWGINIKDLKVSEKE